jgi:hypothetical protein
MLNKPTHQAPAPPESPERDATQTGTLAPWGRQPSKPSSMNRRPWSRVRRIQGDEVKPRQGLIGAFLSGRCHSAELFRSAELADSFVMVS